MQGFPDTSEQFEREKKQAISADSAKIFEGIRDNPTVKAVLAELRHTCYHGVAEYGYDNEPLVFGGFDKFDQVRQDAEHIFDAVSVHHHAYPSTVRIFDAMGAVVWSKERDG